ncbi:MAG: hypothetical protein ACON5N_14435 [Akkermansiaceae bacterium]
MFQADHLKVRQLKTGGKEVSVDGEGMVESLFDVLEGLDGKMKVKAHVLQLSPTVAGDLEGGWRGSGKLEGFHRGQGGESGELLVKFDFEISELTEERISKPGWLDSLKVTKVRLGRSREVLMRDATEERGIPLDMFWDNWKVPREKRVTNTGGVYLNDFNRDGYHDMFVTDRNASFFFVGGPGGTFLERSRSLGVRGVWGEAMGLLSIWMEMAGRI